MISSTWAGVKKLVDWRVEARDAATVMFTWGGVQRVLKRKSQVDSKVDWG